MINFLPSRQFIPLLLVEINYWLSGHCQPKGSVFVIVSCPYVDLVCITGRDRSDYFFGREIMTLLTQTYYYLLRF